MTMLAFLNKLLTEMQNLVGKFIGKVLCGHLFAFVFIGTNLSSPKSETV